MLERKYALLQASALIFSETLDHMDPNNHVSEEDLIESSVVRAELLLAEIERREREVGPKRSR